MAQLTVNLPLSAEDKAILNQLLGSTVVKGKAPPAEVEVEAAPKKRGRPPKAAKAPAEDDGLGLDDDSDLESEDGATDESEMDEGPEDGEEETEDEDGESEEDEEPAPAKKAVKKKTGPTLEDDVIPAFQDYTKRNSREKALAFLKKLGVKTVRDIPEAKYAKVIEALKKK